MKKIVILVFSLFLISGCTATYNLNINDLNDIQEELIINDNTVPKEELEQAFPEILTDFTVIVDDDDIDSIDKSIPRYNRKIEEGLEVNKITYSYDKFRLESIKNSNIIRNGYRNFGIAKMEDKIQFSTNNILNAFDENPTLNSLTINIKTSYDVIESNADSVNGNIYTWNFNREDYNKGVVFIINSKKGSDSQESLKEEEKESNVTEKEEEKKKTPSWVIFLSVGGFFILLFLIVTFKNKFN